MKSPNNCFRVALISRDPVAEEPGWVRNALERVGITYTSHQCQDTAEVSEVARDADLVWVFGGSRILMSQDLHALKNCKAILRSGSGVDNIPVDEATRLGILVANTPDANLVPVAEHTIALLLSVTRLIPLKDRRLRSGTWESHKCQPSLLLNGRTLGLLGLGGIARAVAERLAAWGVKLIAYDPMVAENEMLDLGIEPVDLNSLLARSDFVSIHCPLTSNTRHLLGTSQLRRMQPHSVLINTARGDIVEPNALYKALTEGWIAAAGLDVLDQEPPFSNNPLLQLDNVVITPHIASCHEHLFNEFWRLSVDTCIDLSQGRLPRSRVNQPATSRWTELQSTVSQEIASA